MTDIVNSILIPNIFSEEEIAIDFNDIKELKLMYSKVKKIKKYYLAYMFDPEKNIDALTIYNLIKLYYGKTIFYLIEKQEDKFIVFGGNTFNINESTFFYKEFLLDEIEELEEIDLLNKKFLNTEKSISFFLNMEADTKTYILDILKAKEGNINKILMFIFKGNNAFSKYKVFILSFFVVGIMFICANYYLSQKSKMINNIQTKLINKYQTQIINTKKKIFQLKKTLHNYQLSTEMKIYYKKGKNGKK